MSVSASLLGAYVGFDCERFLKLRLSSAAERRSALASLGATSSAARAADAGSGVGAVSQARCERGIAFEEHLVRRLRAAEARGVQLVDLRGHSPQQCAAAMLNADAGTVFYQSVLDVNDVAGGGGGGGSHSGADFEWLTALRGANLRVGQAKPDFVFVDKESNSNDFSLVIVDAKSSAKDKFSHHVKKKNSIFFSI